MIVPGYKIGLANIAGLFALYMYDEKSLAYVSLLRIILSSLMQGMLFSVSFWLSLSGGSVANLKVSKSANPILDNEAMRVLKMMPKWKPGMDKNKVCRTMIAIPVVFQL